ncbi:MAG: adenylate/guanylate cyclase domain-containing protein [Usitatibacteraceae bacterium]
MPIPGKRTIARTFMEKEIEGAVMFADVSGSTKLYDSVGDKVAYAAVKQCVDAFIEATLKNEGRVIKTIGDEVMAVFPTANGASIAAIDMQTAMTTLEPVSGTRLGARIGYHFGPAIERDGDLFGDTVNLAARLSGVAISGQIIASRATVDLLTTVLRGSCRQLHSISLKGKGEVDICELLWAEAAQTVTVLAANAKAGKSTTLKLRFRGAELQLDASKPGLTFGRDKSAPLVVEDTNASRNHGAFEFRAGKFMLVDHSVNGTWVTFDGNAEFVLRREECALVGRGSIAFGQSRASATEVLEFECR